MMRSATASRTSWSWKMPSKATPAAFLAAISAITTSRFLASSEAVGSSSSRTGCSVMKPRAMLTRCCSPPEKVAGGSAQSFSGRLSCASRARALSRAALALLAALDQRFGDDIERRDARHGAQELADIADRLAAHGKHGARAGGGEIDQAVLVLDDDLAFVDGVVAVEHLQDRALAGAGGAAEHGAFAGPDRERDAGDDRQFDAVAQMHGEAFGDVGNNERRGHDHTCSIEETSNCV